MGLELGLVKHITFLYGELIVLCHDLIGVTDLGYKRGETRGEVKGKVRGEAGLRRNQRGVRKKYKSHCLL